MILNGYTIKHEGMRVYNVYLDDVLLTPKPIPTWPEVIKYVNDLTKIKKEWKKIQQSPPQQ